MKHIIVPLAVVLSQFSVKASSEASVNPKATENMVFLSAYVQGKWKDVSAETVGQTTSVVALDETLKLVAIAQEVSRTHGEEILQKLGDHPGQFCNLAYRFARYSNCPAPLKLRLLKKVLETAKPECDLLLPALTSFELLKEHAFLDQAEALRFAGRLSDSLVTYKEAGVETNRYWKLLMEIKQVAEVDPEFKQFIRTVFTSDLRNDVKEPALEIRDNPNYFGEPLYHEDMYDSISREVKNYWLKTWD